MMKRIIGLFLLSSITSGIMAQRVLSLDSCRNLAINNNKELKMSAEKINAAHYEQKAAFTNFLPKINAMGTYMRTQKEISLLSNDQKSSLSNLGTSSTTKLSEALQQIATANPSLAQLLTPLAPLIPEVGNALNGIGQGLVDALHTDTRNMYAGAVSLTQPVYMGGKITAYNKITKYAEALAHTQHNAELQDIILSTDQAYWQVISVINKKRLAESYLDLVKKLDSDVEKMIKEGVATTTDGLSVKVKVNEAEMNLLTAEDGVSLSKMVLCQLCGMPIDTQITLFDENIKEINTTVEEVKGNVDLALTNRQELKSLEYATKIYNQKINIARSEFLPSLAITADYMVTNPSLVNGFERKFRGMWAVGALVKIPVWNWGEMGYKVKAAKAEANIARYNLENIKEKVELQVNQATYKVNEAQKRLAMATKNMEKANENLRYATLSFSEGIIPTSNVLEAQTAWLSAQSSKIDAQIDVRLTEVYLRKSMGILK